MINISKLAQDYFVNLLGKEKKNTHIRIFVKNPGTKFAECGLTYCFEKEISSLDKEIKYSKFNVYINSSVVLYFKDATIDIIKENENSRLVLNAPYVQKSLLNHSLSLKDKLIVFLNEKINPKLNAHGGSISLVEITEDKHAVLEFKGGCNGCSMAHITLKSGVEKELLKYFPELKKVIDITEHKKGKHSFF
ncbi:NifU family protein [Buchnera aphidicola (Mindarus keteleerifoliae)]|uniref:NifU family protein n=1 Tax=Buchnera aphidicola TaxID=9 RepID=UPI0031B6EF7F